MKERRQKELGTAANPFLFLVAAARYALANLIACIKYSFSVAAATATAHNHLAPCPTRWYSFRIMPLMCFIVCASVFMCIVVVAVDAHRCDVHTGWIYFTTEYISTWILFFFSPAPQSLALLSLMFCCCCGNEGSRLHATPGYCECLWNMNDQEKVRVFRFGRFRCLHSQTHACWVARLLSVDDVKLLSVLCVMGFQCKWEQQRQKVEHCMHIILTGEGTSDCRKGRIIFMILFSPFEMRLFCCYNDKNRTSRSLTHSVCSLPTSHSIDDGKEQQLAQSST